MGSIVVVVDVCVYTSLWSVGSPRLSVHQTVRLLSAVFAQVYTISKNLCNHGRESFWLYSCGPWTRLESDLLNILLFIVLAQPTDYVAEN